MREGDDTFAWLLRRHRLAARLTQEELASRSGLSVRALADMERGRTTRPYRRSVALLAGALAISGSDLTAFTRASRMSNLTPPAWGRPASAAKFSVRDLVVPRQLPAAVRDFVGREAELKVLSGLLMRLKDGPETMVISAVAGPAGVGKTTLAVHWAHRVSYLFPDGQLYVDLRGFDPSGRPMEPEAAVRGFLDALHVPPGQIPAGLDAQVGLYRSLLAGRAILVVLDNARGAEHVRPLLPGSAGCMALVTSRSQLTGLAGAEGAHIIRLDLLTAPEAVALLAARLGPDRVTAEEGAAEQLARLCAGLPLAIGLAAARAARRPAVTLASLAAELQDTRQTFDALATGDATTSLPGVFSWSCRALSPAAARMFRLLGLNPGPDISIAAAGSLAQVTATQARRLLGELAEAQLVAELRTGRFGSHDLLRAYAADCAESQEDPAARAEAIHRLLSWYLHTAVAAARAVNPRRRHVSLGPPASACQPLSFDSHDQALDWLETERANLVAAVACAARDDDHEIAWKLPITLWDLFNLRSHWSDWVEADEIGLASARHLQDRVAEGWLLNHLAVAHTASGNQARAIGYFRQALAIRQAIGDRHGEAGALANLGRAYSEAGQLAQSLECLQQALSIFRETGHKREHGIGLFNISATYRRVGRFQDAMTSALQSLAILRAIGDEYEESGALTQLALASLCLARQEEAVTYSSRAAELSRHHGDRVGEAEALTALGQALHDVGRPDQARQHRRDAYLIFSDLGDPRAGELLNLLDPDSHPRYLAPNHRRQLRRVPAAAGLPG